MPLANQLRRRRFAAAHAAGRLQLPHHHPGHPANLVRPAAERRRAVCSTSAAAEGTLAAESVAFPMVQVFSPLADAFMEPLVARRLVDVRTAQSSATTNQIELGGWPTAFWNLGDRRGRLRAPLRGGHGPDRRSHQGVRRDSEGTRGGRQTGPSREALLLRVEVQAGRGARSRGQRQPGPAAQPGHGLPAEITLCSRQGMLPSWSIPTLDLNALVHQGQTFRPEVAAARAEIARREVQGPSRKRSVPSCRRYRWVTCQAVIRRRHQPHRPGADQPQFRPLHRPHGRGRDRLLDLAEPGSGATWPCGGPSGPASDRKRTWLCLRVLNQASLGK